MTKKEELVEIIEGEHYIVGLRKDNIVHVFYRANTLITNELQQEMQHIFNDVSCGEKKCFIYEGGKGVNITTEARKNALKIESNIPIKASVVVARNSLQRVVADFYYLINKPKSPYHVCTKFEEGIKWLSQFE